MILLKSYTILYAEDESIIRLNITQQLSHYFKKVYAVKDGEEALSMYEQVNPDVLMLDINMPKLSGLDVAHKIRESNKSIPIMIITAYTEEALLLDAVELNLCKYLVKPVSKSKLKEGLYRLEETLLLQKKDIIMLSSEYSWNKQTKKLYRDNKIINLPLREQLLLELMMDKFQKNIFIEDISAIVWKDKFIEEISINTIKKLVSNLRKKLPKNCLKSVYGSGYVLTTT
ncbi:MAG: DNA-binding response regulator [Sulfurovum sp.]|nr:MAG: DNA-binding response regulator [Sulfurovum sp.]